jgi:hypothetical protein
LIVGGIHDLKRQFYEPVRLARHGGYYDEYVVSVLAGFNDVTRYVSNLL